LKGDHDHSTWGLGGVSSSYLENNNKKSIVEGSAEKKRGNGKQGSIMKESRAQIANNRMVCSEVNTGLRILKNELGGERKKDKPNKEVRWGAWHCKSHVIRKGELFPISDWDKRPWASKKSGKKDRKTKVTRRVENVCVQKVRGGLKRIFPRKRKRGGGRGETGRGGEENLREARDIRTSAWIEHCICTRVKALTETGGQIPLGRGSEERVGVNGVRSTGKVGKGLVFCRRK